MADQRALELEAAAVSFTRCGPVTDYLGAGPFMREVFGDVPNIGDRRLALVRCDHGVEWVEGNLDGSTPCAECARGAWLSMPWLMRQLGA